MKVRDLDSVLRTCDATRDSVIQVPTRTTSDELDAYTLLGFQDVTTSSPEELEEPASLLVLLDWRLSRHIFPGLYDVVVVNSVPVDRIPYLTSDLEALGYQLLQCFYGELTADVAFKGR